MFLVCGLFMIDDEEDIDGWLSTLDCGCRSGLLSFFWMINGGLNPVGL